MVESLKQNFIAYRSSKVSDCIFEIPQLWQSGFSRVYSNSCCSCSFEPEIIKIGQSCHKMYNNNILNFQESTTILNACTKKVWKPLVYTSYVYNCNPVKTIHHSEIYIRAIYNIQANFARELSSGTSYFFSSSKFSRKPR